MTGQKTSSKPPVHGEYDSQTSRAARPIGLTVAVPYTDSRQEPACESQKPAPSDNWEGNQVLDQDKQEDVYFPLQMQQTQSASLQASTERLEAPTAIDKPTVAFSKHCSLDGFIDGQGVLESSEEAPDPDILEQI